MNARTAVRSLTVVMASCRSAGNERYSAWRAPACIDRPPPTMMTICRCSIRSTSCSPLGRSSVRGDERLAAGGAPSGKSQVRRLMRKVRIAVLGPK